MTSPSELNRAMRLLASQPGAIFIGQCVRYDGVSMFHDLEGVPMEQRIEFPVAEELNVGAAIGLSIAGYLPIVQIPRIDFLLRATDQLVNHLNQLAAMSHGEFRPKVIIRTRVGTTRPLNAGPQHTQDHTEAFRMMMPNVWVREITSKESTFDTYNAAVTSHMSALIVENLGA